MLKTISTSVRKEDFTQNGVTACHFVTTDCASEHADSAAVPDSLTPVTRHFRADPAAIDSLVEALYKLLIETPDLQPASVPERPESACIRRPQE